MMDPCKIDPAKTMRRFYRLSVEPALFGISHSCASGTGLARRVAGSETNGCQRLTMRVVCFLRLS